MTMLVVPFVSGSAILVRKQKISSRRRGLIYVIGVSAISLVLLYHTHLHRNSMVSPGSETQLLPALSSSASNAITEILVPIEKAGETASGDEDGEESIEIGGSKDDRSSDTESASQEAVYSLPTRMDWQEDGIPEWCVEMKAQPRPWKSVPGTPAEDKTCPSRTPTGECKDGSSQQWFSQHHQDVYLYTKHFAHLQRKGVYWDVAANDAIEISNTFFMDRCLGWPGVCVEANPRYFGKLTSARSCLVVPTCMSSRAERVVFRLSGAVGGVESTVKTRKKAEDINVEIECVTGALIAKKTGVKVVDFMSLDVEGHELMVLKGIDWEETRINVVSSEATHVSPAGQYLLERGYVVHEVATAPEDKADWDEFTIDFRYDTIYLHPGVVWGKPV
jgi:FkbM family methyltransferase